MGLRSIIREMADKVLPEVWPGAALPTHEPNPGPEWISETLAKTWLSWKYPGGSLEDKVVSSELSALIAAGRVKAMSHSRYGLYVDRKDMEAVIAKGTIKLEATSDPAGAYINRDKPVPPPLVCVDPVVGSTEQRSRPLPLPSPFASQERVEVSE